MIFAKYDMESIFKDIQRMELGETVKFLKILQKLQFLLFFSKEIVFQHYFTKSVVLM